MSGCCARSGSDRSTIIPTPQDLEDAADGGFRAKIRAFDELLNRDRGITHVLQNIAEGLRTRGPGKVTVFRVTVKEAESIFGEDTEAAEKYLMARTEQILKAIERELELRGWKVGKVQMMLWGQRDRLRRRRLRRKRLRRVREYRPRISLIARSSIESWCSRGSSDSGGGGSEEYSSS